MQEERRTFTLISESPEETLRIGQVIGENLEAGDVVALIGDLGSGKTCLTKGIARGIRVPDGYEITSPTFTLINEYPGKLKLYHIDIYRLAGTDELSLLGYEEYFYGDGVVVIEWAEKILDVLPGESIFVRLQYIDESKREMTMEGNIQKVGKMFNALREGGFC